MAGEHDEYTHDDPEPRERRSRRSRPVWIVLLAVGCGGALLCAAACAGVIMWAVTAFKNDILPARAAADRFLDQLKEGQVDAAYDSTSANQTRAAFADYVKKFETFTRHTARAENGVRVFQNAAGKRAFVQTTLSAPNNALTCTLALVDEGGTWKVDKITIP